MVLFPQKAARIPTANEKNKTSKMCFRRKVPNLFSIGDIVFGFNIDLGFSKIVKIQGMKHEAWKKYFANNGRKDEYCQKLKSKLKSSGERISRAF
jgi:hypothetical protein